MLNMEWGKIRMGKLFFSFFSFVVLIIFGTLAYSANVDVVSVTGSTGPTMNQADVVKQKLKSTVAATVFSLITLEPVASAKVQSLEEQESLPTQIGFSRNVAMLSTFENTGQQLSWHELPGKGHYSGIRIISPQALALRVGMTVKNVPESAEFRFFSIQEGVAVNIQLVSARKILDILRINREADPDDPDGKIFWSPTVEGDTLGVEIYLPENLAPSSVQVAFPQVSHISIFPFGSNGSNNSVQGYSDSDPCQNDATCAASWINLNKSVAGMQFSTSAGTYVCTGSLLNDIDLDTWKPYFITANHCIDKQSVASTLETHWFWQSAICNGSTLSSSYKKISGGATLLHTQGMSSGEPTRSSMDTTLLILNSKLAAGAYFAGWTTAVPPETGTPRTGIHHPAADWKKISYGTSGGDAACWWVDGDQFSCSSGSGNFYAVDWTDGGTEGGSSGSAFYYNKAQVIGTLTGGGNGSCAGSISVYSSFRAAYYDGNYGQWLYTKPGSIPVVAPMNYLLLK